MHEITNHFADPILDGMTNREVLVDNRENSNELEDYQINLAVDEKQLFFEAQDGLRFVDENLKIIDHWNQSFPDEQWLKVPKIPASAVCSLRMRNANPSASSTSNGINTFKDFDLQDVMSGGTPSASSHYTTYVASFACDNNTAVSSRWLCFSPTGWWKYDLGGGTTKTVRALRYLALNSQCNKDFIIKGSNDNINWDTLHSAQGINVVDNITWQEWIFQNATAYRYYNIVINSSWYTRAGAIEFEIIGTDVIAAAYRMEKIGEYFNTRKYSSPEPTAGIGAMI